MRVMGHNAFAILVAAIAIFAVGFVIYGALFTDAWIAATGWTEEQIQTGASKMPFSPIPSILIAIGMSLAVKWRGKTGWAEGAITGVLMAVFLLIGERFYGFVYAPAGGETWLAIDALYAVVSGAVAGAILGAWR